MSESRSAETGRRLWRDPLPHWPEYETGFVHAYPWNRGKGEDVPRYHKGQDGYWRKDDANASCTALISCAGDLMCEPRMTNACRYGDSYFFHPIFQFVRGIFRSSDLSIGNLETTLSEETPYAGEYHRIVTDGKIQYHCNAPKCYLDAVRYAGFDLLVNANNHDLDSGAAGLMETIRNMDEYGFMHTGTFLPEEEERVLFAEVNGIRLAVLSYATYLNKLENKFTPLGQEKLLNRYSAERVERDVKHAKEKGAEFILAYLHCGSAYKLEPNDVQRQIVREMADAGVDFVVGSHSHCLQYHDTVEAKDGRRVPVVFSMGNFVTNEKKTVCKHTGILQLLLKKIGSRVTVSPYFIPCYVFDEMGTGRFAAVPTDPLLNGGIQNDTLDSAEAFIRRVACVRTPRLPTCAMRLSHVCTLLGTSLPAGQEDGPVNRVCLHVKETGEHTLFFALEPDAETVRKAYQAGAAVVAAESVEGVPVIVTKDVSDAYCRTCAWGKSGFSPVTVAIVGRSGKTKTKELLRQILRDVGPVLVSGDDPNGDTAAWQGLHPQHAYYIQEIAWGDPKRTETMLRALRPDVCVITDGAEELSSPAAWTADGGAVLYDGDDPLLRAAARQAEEKRNVRFIPWGSDGTENVYRRGGVTADGKRLLFAASHPGREQEISVELPFAELSRAALAAFAAGCLLGAAPEKAAEALGRYICQGYEQAEIEVDGLDLLLCATCKTADSAADALRALASRPVKAGGRRIAVLGDPDGEGEDWLCRTAQAAGEAGIDCVCLTGARAREPASLPEMPGRETVLLPDEDGLERWLIEHLDPRDALLLCGGRRMKYGTTVRKVFGLTDGRLADTW